MAGAKEILNRINSINDTMKITNAMYTISSSKLKKARVALQNTEPYFYTLQETIAKILALSPELGNEYFDKREYLEPKERKQGYIVVTADKGLAGAYNHNVLKIAEREALSDNKNMCFVIGQVGRDYFARRNIDVDINFKYTAQNPNMNRARVISDKMIELFNEKKLDEVYIVFTKVINSLNVEAQIKQLLPLKKERLSIKNEHNYFEELEFYPDIQQVFESIIPNYIAGFVYGALIESYCSEHNARMLAMQNATENAKKMTAQLRKEYNSARQSAITQEITEVIAGANAQKSRK